jgi:phospholipase/carboxylesterase
MERLATRVITDRSPTGSRPGRLLFLLHGFGATEHDLTPIGPLLDPDGHFLVAGARGPVAPPEGGAAWFSHGPMGPDTESFHRSFDALQHTLDDLCAEHLLGRDEVVVGGFSQGAAMALALGLSRAGSPPAAGVLCLSGFLADVQGFDYAWDGASEVPVLVQHGRHDDVVPIDLGRDTAAALAMHGVPVTWHEYPMAHQTTIESLRDAREWLQDTFGSPASGA